MQTVLRKARWMPMNAKTPFTCSSDAVDQRKRAFAVDDLLLHLDSHPDDEQALDCYREYVRMRKDAVNEYAQMLRAIDHRYRGRTEGLLLAVGIVQPWLGKRGCR